MTRTYERTIRPEDEVDRTLGGEIVNMPSDVIDEFATHSSLKETIDTISIDSGLTNLLDVDRDKLGEVLLEQSHNLAAEILPPNVSREIGIYPSIPDNAGMHHPPSIFDIELLGAAWDISRDPQTLEAIQHAVQEVDDPKAIIAEKALDIAVENDGSFIENYRKGIEKQLVDSATDEIDAERVNGLDGVMSIGDIALRNTIMAIIDTKMDNYYALSATTYIDLNPHAITYVDHVELRAALSDDEANERLASPIAMPNIELEQATDSIDESNSKTDSSNNGIRISIPLAILPDKTAINNDRAGRLSEQARDTAKTKVNQNMKHKIKSIKSALATRGITQYEF
ncbi:MAG: hypothetical protein WAW80_02330 [Candidatus Saccharimonadales bacterium]